jgi:hypothetical protein
MQRLKFLLCVALVAASATPALGQTAPIRLASSGAQGAPVIPDLSGVWAHPFFPGFEPPLSGPGPVRNKSRGPNGASSLNQLVGDYTNPILKPQAAEAVKKHGEISLAGANYPTPSTQCWPGGVPFVFWDYLMQMLQQPDQITMIYRQGNEVRRVRMNQPHPVTLKPSVYGDSVGYYEGDTLVIDTVGIRKGPFAMVDMFGTPFTEKLHVVERYRLVDYEAAKDAIERNLKENTSFGNMSGGAVIDLNYRGKMLQLHFTVEDEGVFTTPWTATITYWPQLAEWTDLICAENRHDYSSGTDAAVPQADNPDF